MEEDPDEYKEAQTVYCKLKKHYVKIMKAESGTDQYTCLLLKEENAMASGLKKEESLKL